MRISRRSFVSGTAFALAGSRLVADGWSALATVIPVMVRTNFHNRQILFT